MIQIAVLGYGTVGSGVVEVLEKNCAVISKKAGQEINVKYVLDLRDFPGNPIQEKIVHDYEIILNDPEIKIVVEVMGGVEPAFTFSKKALLAGKSVCTSNKELVARHGSELLTIAAENSVSYLFEASCGGGIPIIRPLMTSLTGDVIDEITGILNGTTNYILTKMIQEGSEFGDVLKQAQDLGYAERNPEADVEGFDPCRKIAILSSLAYGQFVNFEDVYTEGITRISAEDIKYIKAMGKTVKLLASSKRDGDKVVAMVAPFVVSLEDPLYSVNGVFNAIFVHGNMLGDAMFYGSGAGKLPTASAVVGDIVDEATHLKETIMPVWNTEKMELADISTSRKPFFVRVKGNPAVDAEEIKAIFGEVEIVEVPELSGEFAFLTKELSEAEYQEKAKACGKVISRIRVRQS